MALKFETMYVPIRYQISEIFAAYLALQSMGISSASTALHTEYVTTLTGKHPKHEQHSLLKVTLHMITYPVLDMVDFHPSPTENRLGFLGPPRPTWCFHGLMIALAMRAALAMLLDIKCHKPFSLMIVLQQASIASWGSSPLDF